MNKKYNVVDSIGVVGKIKDSMIGRKPPAAHPKNCRDECPYGHNRSYCFPCYKKIMDERRAAKAQMAAEG